MQVDRAQQRAVVEKFMAAISTGDVQGLMAVLAPDVVVIADGGGVAAAARKPIVGAERVARFLALAANYPGFEVAGTWLNGLPGFRIEMRGEVTAVSLAVEDGLVTRIYAMRNPEKLEWLDRVAELRR
jgi:RNA polymerase sigma-70 factor (ECF subfamily)